MEKTYIKEEEKTMRSTMERGFNAAKKKTKERKARLSTEEGKKAAMDFIFGNK